MDIFAGDPEACVDLARRVGCEQVSMPFPEAHDFVALVDRVYAAGARVFVEVGPAATLTRLIGAIRKGRQHLALSVDRRGADAHSSLIRLLARFYAYGVSVNLSPLTACDGADE